MKKFLDLFSKREIQSPDSTLLSRVVSTSTPANIISRRKHPRYQINGDARKSHWRVLFADGITASIGDLSFKGAFIKFNGNEEKNITLLPCSVDLKVFRTSIPAQIVSIEKRKHGCGVLFSGSDDEFIVGVSKVIGLLKLGSTCLEVSQNGDKGPSFTQDLNRKRYMGDGPTDLVIDRDSNSQSIIFSMITIRVGQTYGSVIFDKGIIITKKNIDSTGVGARMAQTPQVDQELVQIAAVICSGMKFSDASEIAALLGDWLEKN